MSQDVLDIEGLGIEYPHRFGTFTAVDEVSLSVAPGEIVGLVGESGAGKSTVGFGVIRLLGAPGRIRSGRIAMQGTDLVSLSDAEMTRIRGRRIGIIFQDPMTSLNPLLTVGDQISETISNALGVSGREAWSRARAILASVGIPNLDVRMKQYPHQFSGGMRQRVVIALALCGDPELLIADEPTTALDVTTQKQILELIREQCRKRNLATVLVTHDMGVIAEYTDRVCVMYKGKIVEQGPTTEVLNQPQHDYSQKLIASIPRLDRKERRLVAAVNDAAPDLHDEIDAWMKAGRGGTSDPHAHAAPVFQVESLTKEFLIKNAFRPKNREYFRAVDDVSFHVERGEVLGIVGESGSGKTTVGRMLVRLYEPTSGDIIYNGRNYADVTGTSEAKRLSDDVQIVFQDPYSSLNPRMRVRDIVAEPLIYHKWEKSASEARRIAALLLARVGLPEEVGQKYPHQFSGGQRQRISIARALATRPRVLICDEPTSALDVSIQAEVLNLLKDLQEELDLTIVFISHDLAVIRQMSDRIVIMANGRVCEIGETERILASPEHEYTKSLLAAVPRIESVLTGERSYER